MARMLIVDDKEENLYLLNALLTGHGCEVDTARNGTEALAKARENPPDMVVSDLLMPVMDGFTLLRTWRDDPRLGPIPFVVYTATYTDREDERLALNLGADAFILKPCDPEEFLERVFAVRDRSAAAPPSPREKCPSEAVLLRSYNETLVRKLEERTIQLEQLNRALQEDIAQRKRVEEHLRESEERFRATFEQAAVGIAHVDLDGRFLRVNDKLCDITGHTREELAHLTFIELTDPRDREDGDAARLDMLARKTRVYSKEKRYQTKGGGLIWAHVVTSLLWDREGKPKYFITVVADITERKKLEAQFLRAQRVESVGTLASGIAHDLNNVLAPILMSIDLLRSTVAGEEADSLLRTLQASAQRGADLVRQVLSFAAGVEGRRVLLNPSHLLRELQGIIRDTFPKSISLEMAIKRDLWPVMGDPTQLHQVFLNLCVNARDAMPEGGVLRVHAENAMLDETYCSMHLAARPGAYVIVDVIDCGSGIPPGIRDKIFDPFFTTKEIGKGTGLGLSTTLAIVKSHGGFIDLYSEMGNGSKFRVCLPAVAGGPPEVDLAAAAARPPRGNGEVVLVVDDEEAIREVAKRMLEGFGYSVLLAPNGAEAMSIYARQRDEIKAVVTDMALPIMDGASLIAALKSLNPALGIIASSGLPANGGIAEAAGIPASNFVPKPYTADVLLAALAKLLGKHG